MKTLKLIILHLCCLGWDLPVAAAFLLLWALWGENLRIEERRLKFSWKEGSFPITAGSDAVGFWSFWKIWPRGWYMKNWKAVDAGKEEPWEWGGTSVGNVEFFSPGRLSLRGEKPTKTMVHEDHHTLQARAAAIQATIIALAVLFVSPWMALAIWVLGGNLMTSIGGWTAAWLEGRPAYRGSQHEIAARAVANDWERGVDT